MAYRVFIPPHEHMKNKLRMNVKDMYWNTPKVGIHMECHDLHTSYLDGILSTLKDRYTGPLNTDVPDILKCPEEKKYGALHSHLLKEIKKLRMSMNGDWKRVKGFLDKCNREFIETDPGVNNGLQAIHMQLHVSKDFKVYMLRHLVAEHFALYSDFFAPKMEEYLKASKLTYNKYVYAVYEGQIWCDEFILGAIGHMFNVRISVISPLYTDIWNVFHDGEEAADIVLVANGKGFRTEFDRITHFTATKGKEESWKCVGSHLKLQPVEKYEGFIEGQSMALDFDTININQSILSKSQKVLKKINKLCQNIQDICIERDEIIDDLKGLSIEVGDFQKLTSFYIRDEVPEFKSRQQIPATKRKLEIFPSEPGAIPKVRIRDIRQTETGQKILAQHSNTKTQESEETTNIDSTRKKMLSSHRETSRHAMKRGNTETCVRNKPSSNVDKVVESEQQNRDDTVPPRKRCKIKSGGRIVRAPMLCENPKLPSLGEYSRMIFSPGKNVVQQTREYHLTKNKESHMISETHDKEEGEIDDSDSDSQLGFQKDISDYQTGDEESKNESDVQTQVNESDKGSDNEMDIRDTSEDEVDEENNLSVIEDMNQNDHDQNFLTDFDLSLRDIVKIPEEMLLSPEEIMREEIVVEHQDITSDDKEQTQTMKADKQIDKLEELIKGRIQKSKLTENQKSEMLIGNVSQPLADIQKQNVITVQPIASYDEIYGLGEQNSQEKSVENIVNIKQEPGVTEPDDDIVFVEHEYADVHSQIKTEPTESTRPIEAPSVKRTFVLKNILKALKQPIGEHNVHRRQLSTSVLNTKTKDQVKTTRIPSAIKSTRGKLPKMFIPSSCSTPGKAVKDVSDSRKSTKPTINFIDITGQEILRSKTETAGVHQTPQGKDVIQTKQVSQSHKGTETAPLQVKVHGNIDKQTTIQGNVQNLTIQHVTSPSMVKKVHPAIFSTVPSELRVHVPAVTVETQSELAMKYRARKRMEGKEVVSVQQKVQKEKILPPVPVSEQSDEYFYCDKCDKRFKSKNYFRTHMTRLCKALENPEVLICKTCGKMFKHEKNYKSHLGVHDGVKRFTCSRCGQKFVHDHQLLKHRKECMGRN